ncbi:6-phosphogluconolactonase [Condylostylus longicornis]|uniref:6-phosphogluconolactonase n=1 Tax=Condylostylus longicornis TaxID=2530218 RepID=UPI00244D9CF5|nr:6-phosphogluconolactonase [Condylostylus longicornis]
MLPIIVENENEVIQKLATEIEKYANSAIETNDVFRIGLSGGSLVKYLTIGIPAIQTNWKKWRLFFCDERYVEESNPESTFGLYKQSLLLKTDLEESQFIKINLSLPLEQCAEDYEKKILKEFNLTESENIPEFDLLLLGMGPDGHTCSLFPGHKLLNESKKLIAAIDDSPKPPPKRVTMTFRLINNAKNCIFAMSGDGKAEIVKKVFIEKENLPAGMVNPNGDNLIVILDKHAGIHFL